MFHSLLTTQDHPGLTSLLCFTDELHQFNISLTFEFDVQQTIWAGPVPPHIKAEMDIVDHSSSDVF